MLVACAGFPGSFLGVTVALPAWFASNSGSGMREGRLFSSSHPDPGAPSSLHAEGGNGAELLGDQGRRKGAMGLWGRFD